MRSGFVDMMRVLSVVLLLAGCAGSDDAASSERLPTDSNEWVRLVTRAYDPAGRFAGVQCLRFDYVVRDQNYNEVTRAKHFWNRVTGDYRYEADAAQFAGATFFEESSLTWKKANLKLPAGALVAIANEKTRTGKVYINGKEQPASLLKYVFDRIDNDGKWLVLPLQMADPARPIEVRYVNRETHDGKAGANLAVTTPAAPGSSKHDLWIVNVDAQGKIQHTGIKSPGSFLALVAVWDMDQKVDDVVFCTHRFLGERTIVFEALETPGVDSVDNGVFASVSPMLVSRAASPLRGGGEKGK